MESGIIRAPISHISALNCSISNFANTSYILTDIYAINHTGNFNTNIRYKIKRMFENPYTRYMQAR